MQNDLDNIRRNLNAMYPNYSFSIRHNLNSQTYLITIYRGTTNLDTISVHEQTGLTEFWATIREWAKPFIANQP